MNLRKARLPVLVLGLSGLFLFRFAVSQDVPPEIGKLEAYVQGHPNQAESWVRLGFLYFQAGDSDKARTAFEKVLSLEPGRLTAWYQLGLIYEKQERWGQAETAWEKVLQQSQNERLRHIAKKHLARVQMLLEKGLR